MKRIFTNQQIFYCMSYQFIGYKFTYITYLQACYFIYISLLHSPSLFCVRIAKTSTKNLSVGEIMMIYVVFIFQRSLGKP